MRYLTIIALLLAPSIAQAQPKPATATATPAAGTCAVLMNTYEGASKDMAANEASAIGDNSAPRATLRAMEDANALATAKIALDLMRDNRCSLPKDAPAAIYYLTPALTCATDRYKQTGTQSPPSCDRSTWAKLGK